eukprot:760554-Hanusia_phi.AAC.5
MDGYAVLSSDGAGEFEVVGSSRAGGAGGAGTAVSPGTVCYITTGAPLPAGADAVVMVEETMPGASAGRVKISKAAKPRQNVREVGSDMAAGERVLAAGERVGAAEVRERQGSEWGGGDREEGGGAQN